MESFLIAGIALLLAILSSYVLLFSTSNFISEEIQWSRAFMPLAIGSVLAIYLGVGLLAGSYPALYLSSFQPINIIKGFFKKGTGQDKYKEMSFSFFQKAVPNSDKISSSPKATKTSSKPLAFLFYKVETTARQIQTLRF